MPFQVSPGVNVTEIDLTTIVPAVATTQGVIAGPFLWGPIDERVFIDNENTLVKRFGKPATFNAETWFTAANFLGYGNQLYVSRSANTTSGSNVAYTAVASFSDNTAQTNTNLALGIIKNHDDYISKVANSSYTFPSDFYYVSRYPGALGNSLKISVCQGANAFQSNVTVPSSNTAETNATSSVFYMAQNSNVATVIVGPGASGDLTKTYAQAQTAINALTVGDRILVGNSTIGTQYLQISAITLANAIANNVQASNGAYSNGTYRTGYSNTTNWSTFIISFYDTYRLAADYSSTTFQRNWEYATNVDKAPGRSNYVANFGNTVAQAGNTSAQLDEIHVVVADHDGTFTGVPGTVLEVYPQLSRATDSKSQDGATIYVKNVINEQSQYVYMVNDDSSAPSNTAVSVATATGNSFSKPQSHEFWQGSNGADETTIPLTDITRSYDLYASAENVDISLVLTGKSTNVNLANYLIDNIAEQRKDCIVFVSPRYADVVNQIGNEMTNIITFSQAIRSSSYAVMDSGYKYIYDRYSDIYRWVPLNGDTAGLCVRTDNQRDPWWSPAGFNRGQIKNLIKLAYNPNKAARDQLYPQGVNPVVSFPGQGTILYGDKTHLAKPSAFDRINVRRLFIVLEKAISTAAKFTLFEFNDQFTRAQFTSLINPYLRDIKGRRGITDFLVVCDDTNNTPERIDRNEFWGDIYIKPARSINFIQLNFVAVRTGVQFSEVVGQF